jgi:hypothetical protein
MDNECIPARLRNGEIASHCRQAKRIARQALIEREGPPPTSKHVCRHLCVNDSQCHKRVDGFVCVIHTTWGTHIENMNDKPIEKRLAGGRAACNLEYTCPYCGKAGRGPSMKGHINKCKCKSRPQSHAE